MTRRLMYGLANAIDGRIELTLKFLSDAAWRSGIGAPAIQRWLRFEVDPKLSHFERVLNAYDHELRVAHKDEPEPGPGYEESVDVLLGNLLTDMERGAVLSMETHAAYERLKDISNERKTKKANGIQYRLQFGDRASAKARTSTV